MQPVIMIMIYSWYKKPQKKIACPGGCYNNNWKNTDVMYLAKRIYFLQDVFQMTAIELISAINYYHINGLHLFWDTLVNNYSLK